MLALTLHPGTHPNMCPRGFFFQSHCLLFSFIPSNLNRLKQYPSILGQRFLLLLASVLYLVSEALTIFGANIVCEGHTQCRHMASAGDNVDGCP